MYKVFYKAILSTTCLAIMLSGCGGKKKKVVALKSPTTSGVTLNENSAEYFAQNVGDTVYFDFDKSNLSPEAKSTLQKQAEWLKAHPEYMKTILVAGHCDATGTEEYNMALGARRAHSAKSALSAAGISKVKTTSFGKTKASGLDDGSKDRKAITMLNGDSAQ